MIFIRMDSLSGQWNFKVFLGITLLIMKLVMAEDHQFLVPVIFPYGDCENTHALQEVLLHLRTADCSNLSALYQYDHFANNEGSLHQRRHTFHSPEAVVLLSSLEDSNRNMRAPELLLIPPVYCRGNKSGVVVRVYDAPDVASIGTYVAPHYLQSLSLFPYTEEGQVGNFQYHILQGVNEKSGFTIATLYDDTAVSVLPTRDVTGIRNGWLPFASKANHYSHATYRKHEVLWLEALDCNNTADTLTGSIITSNKPIAVYTAKAECSGFNQFSNAAHVIHQMPPTKYWGKTFVGDTIAFQQMDAFQIVLHLVGDSDSTVEIIWYHAFEGDNAITISKNLTLSATVAQTVSVGGSNISHFCINSQHNLLVVYEVCSAQNATNTTEVYSSVLLQPVEWFSHVQSVYWYRFDPPRRDITGQHHCISIVVHRESFDPEQIELVWNSTQGVRNEKLKNFGSNYSVYETGQYVLIHLNVTAAGLDANGRIVHTVQYREKQAKLGATVYSVGGSQSSGLSYSNGYFRSEGDLEECYPGLSSSLPHITSSNTFNVFTDTSTSTSGTVTSLSTGQTEQPMGSSTTDGISPSKITTEATTISRPTDNPRLSTVAHSELTPMPVTRSSSPSGTGTNTLAVAMGTIVGGLLILLLIFICLLVFSCFKTKRVRIVERYQMHDWGRPKYLRLEEPPTAGCEYDVLLSFAEEDCPFVENSIYNPLRRRGYSVFWHHDDFMPGLSIEENICRAIDKSRRIILVCTENFMNSAFCLMELHYSMVRQYQVGIRCIIAIIFDERHCPRGLQGLNYIKLSRGDLDEDEIESLIDRLSLGEPVEPLSTAESAQESPTLARIASQGTRRPTDTEQIEERQQNWISNVL